MPRGMSAAAWRASVAVVVDVLQRTGFVHRERAAPRALLDLPRRVTIAGKHMQPGEVAWRIEGACQTSSPELGAALRAAVLIARGAETWADGQAAADRSQEFGRTV